MRIKPTIGSVIAPTDDQHWGQVLILPTAYGVIEVVHEGGNAQRIGLGVLGKLSEILSDPIVSLGGLEKIASDIQSDQLVSAVILVPVGMVVYLVQVGNGAVYLSRDKRLAKLLTSAGSLSGELILHDTLLLATQSFLRALGEGQLIGAFDDLDAKEIAEKLTMLLSEHNDGVGAAGLVFGVDKTIPEDVENLARVPLSDEEAPVDRPRYVSLRMRLGTLRRTTQKRFPAATNFIYPLRERLTGKNGIFLAIAIVSLGIFAFSVLLGIRNQYVHRTQTSVTSSLADAQHAFEEGAALLDLNPVKGRERLTYAKGVLETLTMTVSAKTKTGRDVKKLYQQVSDRLTLAMQVYRGDPQLFYDAGLLKKGASVTAMALSNDVMALLDSSGKTIFTLALATKNGQVVAGGDAFVSSRLVAIHGDGVFVLVADGVHLVRLSDKKTTMLVVKKDAEWESIASLVAFGGNLYLLDTGKSRIWKYVATGEAMPTGLPGFSERRQYLNPDTLPDMTRSTDMAIDGSVWIGTTVGKIMRFTQGKEHTFVPQGVTPAFGKNLVVYTMDEITHVYVLDNDSKRVVMLAKDGTYLSQYVWESPFKPTHIVVSESLKKILLLADGKIYALEMQ